jgi:hypothetical protein
MLDGIRARLRRHPEAATLAVGLACGAAVGGYVRAWWGGGLFGQTTTFSVIGLLAVAGVVLAASVEARRSGGAGRADRARASGMLAVGLVVGTLAGGTFGPAFRPVANYAGTVSVRLASADAPDATTGAPGATASASDATYGAICMVDANASDVARIYAGGWVDDVRSCWRTSVSWGMAGQLFVGLWRGGACYDSAMAPPATLEVRNLGTDRLSGEIAFTSLHAIWRTDPPTTPPPPLSGTIRWTCDPAVRAP